MDIKVGKYIRTKSGFILKVLEYDEFLDMYLATDQENYKAYASRKDIVKHSFNIIDLIQVGDIIEFEIQCDMETNNILRAKTQIEDKEMIEEIKESEDLKIISFLTKEQYEQNCYKLEEFNENRN